MLWESEKKAFARAGKEWPEMTFRNKENPSPSLVLGFVESWRTTAAHLAGLPGEAASSKAGRFQLRQKGEGKDFEKWLGIQRKLSFCVTYESIAQMKGERS